MGEISWIILGASHHGEGGLEVLFDRRECISRKSCAGSALDQSWANPQSSANALVWSIPSVGPGGSSIEPEQRKYSWPAYLAPSMLLAHSVAYR